MRIRGRTELIEFFGLESEFGPNGEDLVLAEARLLVGPDNAARIKEISSATTLVVKESHAFFTGGGIHGRPRVTDNGGLLSDGQGKVVVNIANDGDELSVWTSTAFTKSDGSHVLRLAGGGVDGRGFLEFGSLAEARIAEFRLDALLDDGYAEYKSYAESIGFDFIDSSDPAITA